ncbi:hypothetical protein EMCRGX_G034357 [Ephydatia muelleri]
MGRAGWRLFTYDSLNFEGAKPTTSTLGITSQTYTLASISENDLYHGYGCDETNDVVFIVFPINVIDEKPEIKDKGNARLEVILLSKVPLQLLLLCHHLSPQNALLLHHPPPLSLTSTYSFGPFPTTSSITPLTSSSATSSPSVFSSDTLVGTVGALAAALVILLCIVVTVVVVLRCHKRSKSCCTNKWWDSSEEIPDTAFRPCYPRFERQNGVIDSNPQVPSENESTSNYDMVSYVTPVVTDDPVDPGYAHLNHQMPKPLPQVEIYSQLKRDQRSSHSSLHSDSSSNSHTNCLSPHTQLQRTSSCPPCHSSQSLCPCSPGHASYSESKGHHHHQQHHHRHHHHACCCCDGYESGHRACCDEYEGSHAALVESSMDCCSPSRTCHNSGAGHAHSRAGSLTCYEKEETLVFSSEPANAHPTHTQPDPPTSQQRPAHLPLVNNRDNLQNNNNPPRMKTATSHLQPPQPQPRRQRSQSLTTITEMPTPIATPAEPQLQKLPDERTLTPMPPLRARGLQAAFSTHDIPAIVLSSGTPDTAPNKLLPILVTLDAQSQSTTVSHNSRVGVRSGTQPLTSTAGNQVSLTVKLPSEAGGTSNLKPDSTARRSQGRKAAKEQWTLPKRSVASVSGEVTVNTGSVDTMGSRAAYSLPYSSRLEGSTAWSDSGYEDSFQLAGPTVRKAYSMRLPDKGSAETMV